MAGIDKIVEKILSDANEQAAAIKADAAEKSRLAVEAAKSDAEAQCARIIADAQRAAENSESLSASSGEQKYRQAVLAAKIEILDKALEELHAHFLALPEDDYFKVLCSLAASGAHSGESGLARLNKKDYARKPAELESMLNSALGEGTSLVLDTATADISGGIMLIYGDIEENYSFEALISSMSDELRDKASEILFS